MQSPVRPRLRLTIALVIASLSVVAVVPAGLTSASASPVTDKQAEARQIADKLDALSSKLMTLANQSEVARQHLLEANKGVDAAKARVDSANADTAKAKSQLASYAIDAYVSGNNSQSFDAIVSSKPSDAPIKSGYVQTLTANRADLIDQLANARQRATDEGIRLKAQLATAQAEADKIANAQSQANAAVSEQNQLKAKVSGELASLVAAEQQRRDAAAAAQARLAAEQAAATRFRAPVDTTGPGLAPTTPSGPVPAPNGGGAAAVAAAMSKLGAPYAWGAAGPNSFDCSGLTLWAWAHAGVSLPHYTGSQLAVTRAIPISALQPGDLVFVWGPGESGDPGHVGLYIGGGQMVHAPNGGSWVKVDSIYWWTGSRISAGRVA